MKLNDTQLAEIHHVTLMEILDAKEQRVISQQQLLNQYQKPLISLTINMPGSIKLNEYVLVLFNDATQQILTYCQQQKIKCIYHLEHIYTTGPEGFFIIDQDDSVAKQACIDIENTHPLGRLWDIDVISPSTYQPLSRTALGHPPRRCLICDNDAKICARACHHTTSQLIKTIEDTVKAYHNR